jgi:hypothetical protein
MVKEFEQQNEQDLALLIDPWLPKNKSTLEQREAVENLIRFAATVCLETCRSQGRRFLLGWTGSAPGIIHSPASIKLLHELLESLALMQSSQDGELGALIDLVPPHVLREALVVIVTTRPLSLQKEFERSQRLGKGSASARIAGRIILLDSSRGDLDELIRFQGRAPSKIRPAASRVGPGEDHLEGNGFPAPPVDRPSRAPIPPYPGATIR